MSKRRVWDIPNIPLKKLRKSLYYQYRYDKNVDKNAEFDLLFVIYILTSFDSL